MAIVLTDKSTGESQEYAGPHILIDGKSTVKIINGTGAISRVSREDSDLIVSFRDGKVIKLINFYRHFNGQGGELIVQDGSGNAWLVKVDVSGNNFVLEEIDPNSDDDDGIVAFAPVLLGLAGVGALAGVLASSSGGDDAQSEDGSDLPTVPEGEDTGDGDGGTDQPDGDGDGDGESGAGGGNGNENGGTDVPSGDGDSDGDGEAGLEKPVLEAFDDVIGTTISLSTVVTTREYTRNESTIDDGFTDDVYEFDIAEGIVSDATFKFDVSSEILDLINVKLEVFIGGKWVELDSDYVATLLEGTPATLAFSKLEAGKYRLTSEGGSEPTLSEILQEAHFTDTSLIEFEAEAGPIVKGNILDGSGRVDQQGDILSEDGLTVLQIDVNGSGKFETINNEVVVQGEYGFLTIKADGSYSYQLGTPENPEVVASAIGQVDSFTYKLVHPSGVEASAQLHVQIGSKDITLVWDENDPSVPATSVVANNDTATADIEAVNKITNRPDENAIFDQWDGAHSGRKKTITQPFTVAESTTEDVTLWFSSSEWHEFNLEFINVNTGTTIHTFTNLNQLTKVGDRYKLELKGLAEGKYEVSTTHTEDKGVGYVKVDIEHVITHLNEWKASETTQSTSGNVLDDDVLGSFFATLSVQTADGKFVMPGQGGLSIEGKYGTLVINADGNYTYTPKADLTSVGQSDSFTYQVTGPNGESTTAQLVITIQETGERVDGLSETSAEEAGESNADNSYDIETDVDVVNIDELPTKALTLSAEPLVKLDDLFDLNVANTDVVLVEKEVMISEEENSISVSNDNMIEHSLDYLVTLDTEDDKDLMVQHII